MFLKTLNRRGKEAKTANAVLLPVSNTPGKYVYYCPGCEQNHVINTNPYNNLPVHILSGSLVKPTVRASVLSKGDKREGKPHCHSFITNGKIEFLSDCTHSLAGKTIPMVKL